MSHKQTNSLCTIPFSWEMIPGVPKYMTSPNATTLGGLHKEVISQKAHLTTPPPPAPPLPPPGCFRDPIMKRSASSIFWREEDPFLVALKECSKDSNKVKSDKKKFGIWGNKSFLWCRCSFDVEEGNLVRKRPLPSRVASMVHQQRAHGLIRMHKGSRKWNIHES